MGKAILRITGYADRFSVAPGETIKFMVSCEALKTYRADIVRIICGDANPAGPGYKEARIKTPVRGTYRGRKQAIHAGSYVIVPPHPVLADLASFTVQAMIWPTTPAAGEQVLIAKWSERKGSGFQLLIDASGAVAFRLGRGAGKTQTFSTARALRPREWYAVAASYDAKTGAVVIRQEPVESRPARGARAAVKAKARIRPALGDDAPLTMAARIGGAAEGRPATTAHYNGKIEAPRLANRALSPDESTALQYNLPPFHLDSAVVGAWEFAGGIPAQTITDISHNRLHGETVNMPTRGMKGHNWDGSEWRWSAAPEQYGAIHFHDDDLYDAGWEPDFELVVPRTMRSGCYAVHLKNGRHEDYIPFYVRPPRGKATAKIAYLAPTTTYMAYANGLPMWSQAWAEADIDRLVVIEEWERHLALNREFGVSMYDVHSDGSSVCYSSRLRPILNMRPKTMMAWGGIGSALWGYNADTHLTDWLEAKRLRFDVITDEDLHEEGMDLLKPYRVVLTGTHPEYTSRAMLDAVTGYTDNGGRLMYLGGNGFYWNTVYHPTLPGIVELRRAESGTRTSMCDPGEYFHSFTGELGGLWRFLDRPPNRLVGTGFTAEGFNFCGYYRRTRDSFNKRVRFIFDGIDKKELIGDFGLIGGGAAGIEIDCVDSALGTPPHALVLAQSEDLSDAYLLVHEQQLVTVPDNFGDSNPLIRADIVFFETSSGGAVFSVSSIAWCGSLAHNAYRNNVSRMTENVLRRFIDDKPL